MKNIEITVKVNGENVPLSTISTETFEKIKASAEQTFKPGDIFIEEDEIFPRRAQIIRKHDGSNMFVLLSLNYNYLYNSGKEYIAKDIHKITRKEIDNSLGQHWRKIDAK